MAAEMDGGGVMSRISYRRHSNPHALAASLMDFTMLAFSASRSGHGLAHAQRQLISVLNNHRAWCPRRLHRQGQIRLHMSKPCVPENMWSRDILPSSERMVVCASWITA
jgi:hypothetical protein